jgi:hypothetical protein
MEDRKIMASIKITALAFCLMFFLGSALASPYAFGTKVFSTDSDFGSPLSAYLPSVNPIPDFSICYWETGVVAGFDNTDVVYLHQGAVVPISVVLANDVRLTPFGNLPAGSKVTPQDNDIGMRPLALIPGPANIGWVNLYGGPGHDLDDPVYLHQGPVPGTLTLTNDVRLTAVAGNGPGTRVGNLDPDLSRTFSAWVPNSPASITALGGGGVQFPALIAIRYVDVNGNGQYDYPDDVYLVTTNPRPPNLSVRANDLRLSGPV